MDRWITYSIIGFFAFLILISAVIGVEQENAESNGYYYGTNEWMWPVPDCRTVTSKYGQRSTPTAGASSFHKGIDIGCAEGTDVVATRSGTVTIAEKSAAEGYWIAIKHDKNYMSYYMHNSTLLVKAGDKVEKGEVIALSGNTGVSTGPHSHFAILKNGNYEDPLKYVNPEEKIEYTTSATTGLRQEIVEYAKKFIGNKYVYGGTSLTNGTDCSGFTMRIYEHFNISIPRTTTAQYEAAEKISKKDLLPGDLIFYKDSSGAISHVSMYIGGNKVIHASNSAPYPQGGIKISDFNYRKAYGYGRFLKVNYSEEDLKYMAACIAAEAISTSKEGQYAVGYVVMNRVNADGFGKTVKEVVTAKGQFNSPWNQYLKKPPEWALSSARAVLDGSAKNPIGKKCYFISLSYAKQLKIDKKGTNVGDNVFYSKCIW